MDPEEIVDKALSLGATEAVAQVVKAYTLQVKFVNNQGEVSQSWNEKKLEIFLSLNKRIVSTTVSLQNKDLNEILEELVKRARLVTQKDDYYGIASGSFNYQTIRRLYDKKIAGIEDYGSLTEEAIQASLEAGAERTAGVLETRVFRRELSTSGGVRAKDRGTSVFLSIRAMGRNGGSGHAVACSRRLVEFKPWQAGEEAGKIACMAENPKEGKKGRYRVLFHPLAFAPILENAGEAASIFSVEAGLSFLAGKLMKKVGGENFNLFDDGSLEGGLLSRPFDDEGVPTRRNVIIENGILKGYLHNTSTAKKYNTTTTANAGLLSPRPWNIMLPPGDLATDDMLSELGSGLYITNVWYTRFQNYTAGDFSTVPRDGIFLVENGEVVESIGGIRISDNMNRIFSSLAAISKETRQIKSWEVSGSVISPWVIVDNVGITRAAE